MTHLSCRAVRKLLGAHHDGELTVDRQIAVETHLSRCPDCASRRDDLMTIQMLVREGATSTEATAYEDDVLVGVISSVIDRAAGERRRGWPERVNQMMVDATRFWIPGGAVAVTFVAALVLGSALSFLTPTSSDSLAAVLRAQETLGSNENPVVAARGVTIAPRVSPENGLPIFLSAQPLSPRANLALAAVISREGEVSRVQVLGVGAFSDQLQLDLSKMTADIRFKPALYAGAPVAVNVVWLLEQTTVRPDGLQGLL